MGKRNAHNAKRRILIADDDPMIRLVACQALSQFGHDVYEAVDGDEAVQCCCRRAVDLAILDYAMPGRSGLAAAEALRKLEVPFLFLTASEDLNVMRAAVKEGAHGYLLKPIGPKDLIAAVQAALERADDAQRMVGAIQRARDINVAVGILMCQQNESRERATRRLLDQCRPRRVTAQAVALEIIHVFEATLSPQPTGERA